MEIDPDRIPRHIGIIMDGNGRWAESRGRNRSFGHREGLNAAKRVVKTASDLGISFLTLYTFSTENWKRSEHEVSFLMALISQHLKREMDFYRNQKIRIRHVGDASHLPEAVRKELSSVIADTEQFGGLSVLLAINYGGRDEILRALRRCVYAELADEPPDTGVTMDSIRTIIENIDENGIQSHLDCPDVPDPDLIIRTAGDIRLSNFLLWQSAYSELYFSPKYWPDWQEADLRDAVVAYQSRKRRFGGAG